MTNPDPPGADLSRRGFLVNYPPFRKWRPEALAGFFEPRPLGIYIHVPYCIQRCAYCFYKVTTLSENRKAEIDRYVSAVCREIELAAARFHLAERPVKTLYFGGGTPTLLSKDNLSRIFETIATHLRLDAAEITVEVEPVTLTASKAEHLQRLGVSRISVGIQSFSDEIVAKTGRCDSEAQALQAIALAKSTSAVVNIDLMSGLAGETDATWAHSLERAVESDVHTITVYKTELYHNSEYFVSIKQKRLTLPSDEDELRFTKAAFSRFEAANYHPVTFFTFARSPQHLQQHFARSWRGHEVYGFGVSAFGLFSGYGLQNSGELPRYIAMVEEGELPLVRAYRMTARDQMIRDIALGFKLISVDRAEFKARYGSDLVALCRPALDAAQAAGLVEVDAAAVRLTRQGILWGDYVGHCVIDALEAGAAG